MPPEPLLTRSLALAPETLNREARTVEAVLTTGAAVRRAGFTERLAVGPEHVEVAPHIPLLDGHRSGSIRDVLGRVSNVRFEGGRMLATLHLTSDEAFAAVERGDIRGVSIGYTVSDWSDQ
jgi:Uncharacterized protein conserved in bacteria (DUF2213)